MKDSVKTYLLKLAILVKHLEKELVKRYSLKNIPYNEVGKALPREGTFVFLSCTIYYKFHGAGCLFRINNIELDYDVAPLSSNNIKLSPWKFLNFLKTCSNNENDIKALDQKQVFDILLEFEKCGILIKTPESIGTFEIQENWIEENIETSDPIEIILKSLTS